MTAGEHSTVRWGYIDALRGYAVLMVIAAHVPHLTPAASPVIQRYAHDGAYGVQLFFVVSALTLCASWHSRGDGVVPFYVRRLFRIAPAFWLAIAVYLILDGDWRGFWAPHGVSKRAVALTGLFVNGWHPETINAVVPGCWSIAVEMGFYLIFPLLAIAIRSLRGALIAVAVSLALTLIANPMASHHVETLLPDTPKPLVYAFAYFWLPNQLPVFLMGFAANFLLLRTRDQRANRTAAELLPLALMFLAAMPALDPVRHHFSAAAAFAVLAVAMGTGAGEWLANPIAQRIGKVSFSMYLWHFAVLVYLGKALSALGVTLESRGNWTFALLYLVTVGLTFVVSEFVDAILERPMIRLGNRLIDAHFRPGRPARAEYKFSDDITSGSQPAVSAPRPD